MTDIRLKTLCDIATEVHTRFQSDFKDINLIVGVSQHMRKNGIPADAMTIECLGNQKRIILVLHDHEPDTISYQLTYKDQDPGKAFTHIQFEEMTQEKMYGLVKEYFV